MKQRHIRAANDNTSWTFGVIALALIAAHLLIYITVVAFSGVPGA